MERIPLELPPSLENPTYVPEEIGYIDVDEHGKISGQVTDPIILAQIELGRVTFPRFRTTICE